MGHTWFCSGQEVCRKNNCLCFCYETKAQAQISADGSRSRADDIIQGINAITRHRLGNSGSMIPNCSGRERGYRCLPFPECPPTPTCTLVPISQSFSGKTSCFQMLLPNLRNVYCCSGYVQEEGEGKAVRNFQQFLLGEGPPNFLKGAMEEQAEKARGSVPF